MKINLKSLLTGNNILFGALVLLLVASNGISRCSSSGKLNKLKKEILAKDRLTQEAAGEYRRLVNDLRSQRDLSKLLKDDTTELSQKLTKVEKRLEDEKAKLLSLTSIAATFTAVDSLETMVEIDSLPVDSTIILRANYPAANPFIETTTFYVPSEGLATTNWHFNTLPLSIVVSETQSGMWESRVIGPDWLKISSLEVNTVSADKVTTREPFLKPLIGLRMSREYPQGALYPGIHGGVVVRSNFYILGDITTSGVVGVSILTTF